MKTCGKCGYVGPPGGFSAGHSACKACARAYAGAYRVRNKEKIAAYRTKNKEKIAAAHAVYHIKNKEKIATIGAAYYEKNKEKIGAQKARYYAKNREKIAAAYVVYYMKNKEKIVARVTRYHGAQREVMSDSYIKKLLTKRSVLQAADIPPELIALKRQDLRLKRLIKECKQNE